MSAVNYGSDSAVQDITSACIRRRDRGKPVSSVKIIRAKNVTADEMAGLSAVVDCEWDGVEEEDIFPSESPLATALRPLR